MCKKIQCIDFSQMSHRCNTHIKTFTMYIIEIESIITRQSRSEAQATHVPLSQFSCQDLARQVKEQALVDLSNMVIASRHGNPTARAQIYIIQASGARARRTVDGEPPFGYRPA